MIEMCYLADDKLGLPRDGGTMGQTQAFIDSLRFVKGERWRKESCA